MYSCRTMMHTCVRITILELFLDINILRFREYFTCWVSKFKMPSIWKISVIKLHHCPVIYIRKTLTNMKVSGVCPQLNSTSKYKWDFPTRIKIIQGSHSLYNLLTWVTLFSLNFIPFYCSALLGIKYLRK